MAVDVMDSFQSGNGVDSVFGCALCRSTFLALYADQETLSDKGMSISDLSQHLKF